MSTTAGHLLPYELLLAQLETLDVCSSLFPLEGELTLSTDTRQALPLLRLGAPSSSASSTFPSALIFTLLLSLARPSDDHPFPLSLTISLPLSSSSPSTEPPPAHLTLHQPPWLSRSAHAALAANLSALTTEAEGGGGGNSELILEAVEWLREEATSALPVEEQEEEQNKVVEEEWRVWFVLVSLSTREKRDDMVNWAPDYNITGFVLAGKPALLVLEGTAKNINAYMNDIKSRSWADIPSFQKKVSERTRTLLTPSHGRAFDSMDEITSLISRGGHRGNRGEMGEVRDFLESKGLGESFGEVLGQGNFS